MSQPNRSEDGRLSQDDVLRLIRDGSADARVDTAAKVARAFGRDMTDAERRIGIEIFRIMVLDVEVRVRAALSHHLKRSPDLPRDVAVTLARDVEAVSVPMLESSTVLTDEDLLSIVASQTTGALAAVARREQVSAAVSDALVGRGDLDVVTALLGNAGATIAEPTLARTIEGFGGDEKVQEAMVRRPTLPVTIAERLVSMVSDRLREYLVSHHELPAETAADLILDSRERATVALLPPGVEGGVDIERLLDQMHSNGRLTPTVLLRALCLGDLSFFEAGVARLAGVPLVNARLLIHDTGRLGFPAIYARAGLPAGLMPAFHAVMETVKETQYDGGERDRERFVRRMLERILTRSEVLAEQLGPEMMDYLLRKLEEYAETA